MQLENLRVNRLRFLDSCRVALKDGKLHQVYIFGHSKIKLLLVISIGMHFA